MLFRHSAHRVARGLDPLAEREQAQVVLARAQARRGLGRLVFLVPQQERLQGGFSARVRCLLHLLAQCGTLYSLMAFSISFDSLRQQFRLCTSGWPASTFMVTPARSTHTSAT